MANLDYSGITLQQHINSGDEFLIGYVDNWGSYIQPDSISAIFSNTFRSIKSLAIGPDSDVDRVTVRYALPGKNPAGAKGGPTALNNTVILSNKQPVLSTLRSGQSALLVGFENTLKLYSVGRYGATYQQEGNPVEQPFGPDMTPAMVNIPVFYAPRLQVVLSGSSNRLTSTWGRRNPKKLFYYNPQFFTVVGSGVEAPFYVIPISGRTRLAVVMKALSNGVFKVRLSTVTVDNGDVTPNTPVESQIAPGGFPATAPLPENAQIRFDLQLAASADFLIIYATRISGGVNATITIYTEMYDD